jgi:leucyl-tRNA synthetase
VAVDFSGDFIEQDASSKSWNEYRLMILNELRRVSNGLKDLATEVREMKTALELQKKENEAISDIQHSVEAEKIRVTAIDARVQMLEIAEKANGKTREAVHDLSKKAYAAVLLIGVFGPKLLDYLWGLIPAK